MKTTITALLLAGCALPSADVDPPPPDLPEARWVAPTPPVEPRCRPATTRAAQQFCCDVESGSHAAACPAGADAPRGAFPGRLPGEWCWCRAGECPGVEPSCAAGSDCAWLPGATCQAGLCAP